MVEARLDYVNETETRTSGGEKDWRGKTAKMDRLITQHGPCTRTDAGYAIPSLQIIVFVVHEITVEHQSTEPYPPNLSIATQRAGQAL